MGRRSGFSGLIAAAARDVARAQRQPEANYRRQVRERERASRQAERARTLAMKEARQRYLEERAQEVEDRNRELAERMDELRSVLEHTLTVDDTITFNSLRIKDQFPPFTPPRELTTTYAQPVREQFLSAVKAPGLLGKM